MDGLFGGLFDLDGNGEMDALERAIEFQVLDEMTREDDGDDSDDTDEDY